MCTSALPNINLVLRPQGFIIEAIFATAALATAGFAASMFGMVFSTMFAAFAVFSVVTGVLWIAGTFVSMAMMVGLGVAGVTFLTARAQGKPMFGDAEDKIRRAQEEARQVSEQYSNVRVNWKDGSVVTGVKKEKPIIDIELDPIDEEKKKKAKEMEDDLQDFDRRLRSEKK